MPPLSLGPAGAPGGGAGVNLAPLTARIATLEGPKLRAIATTESEPDADDFAAADVFSRHTTIDLPANQSLAVAYDSARDGYRLIMDGTVFGATNITDVAGETLKRFVVRASGRARNGAYIEVVFP